MLACSVDSPSGLSWSRCGGKNRGPLLAEYSEVLALLIVRPDLRAEFQEEEEPEKFWRNHVQRGKARKAILAALPLKEHAQWWAEYKTFRREERKVSVVVGTPELRQRRNDYACR